MDGFSDVLRANTGALGLIREPLDLAELVRKVVGRHSEELARARCQVRLSAAEPVTGRYDRSRMEQVVVSLLGNAVKYGPGKPIEIGVEARGNRAVLTVSDSGIGISPEFQPRVFERFSRVVSMRHYGGFGLGLWMVVQIVRAHGGDVALDSAPGEGARFEVELPRSDL